MSDGIRVTGSQEHERQFFSAPEIQQTGNDSTPSWVRSILSLLTQFLTNQQSTRQEVQKSEDTRAKHSQPHPEKFTGNDVTQYPQFRSLLEAKLEIDAKAIGSEKERVWYGFGRLTDTALRRIHPWIEFAKDTEDFSVKEFFSRLDKAFGDPHKITKAVDRLNSIRQGNRDFREFLQDFEQTLLEAQAWGWTDEAKKGYLRAGINRDLTDRLVSQLEPKSYDDFVTQLRTTSDKMEAVKAWDNRRNRNRYVPQSSNAEESQASGDQMDWEPAPPVNVAAAQRNFVNRPNQSQRARAKWVSYEEIGRRISEGLCIRCGGQGHMIRDCSFLPALNPDKKHNFQSQRARVSTAEIQTEQEVREISGKV